MDCDFFQGVVGRAVSHPDEVEVFGIAPLSRDRRVCAGKCRR